MHFRRLASSAVLGSALWACSSNSTAFGGGTAGQAGSEGGAGAAGSAGAAGGVPITVEGLNAEAQDLGDGRVRLFWDFSTEDQLEDWLSQGSVLGRTDDGQLQVDVYGEYDLALAVLRRGILIDSLSYTVRVTRGNHVNVYVSSSTIDDWNPIDGYGCIHRDLGFEFVAMEREFQTASGTAPVVGRDYECSIEVTDEGLTWTVDGEEVTWEGDVVRNTTRLVALGTWASTVTFDDVTIIGELGEP